MSEVLSERTEAIPEPPWANRDRFWRFAHFVLSPFFRRWVRVSFHGVENIDDSQGGLLLFNHQSYLDPMIGNFPLRRPISYMAREELFRVPGVSFVLRHTFTQSISQTAFRGSSIRRAVQRMQEGFLVGIFPEGERTSGEVKKFNRGFLSLVRRVNVPIYPVGIVGADCIMPVGSPLIRRGAVKVVYGQPLSPADRERLLSDIEDDDALAELMRQRVAECMAQARSE